MRKIADLPETHRCRHPEHNPPTMIVLPPGIYEHACPGCGHKQTVRVTGGPTLHNKAESSVPKYRVEPRQRDHKPRSSYCAH